jgi:predicted Zn-dependent protease
MTATLSQSESALNAGQAYQQALQLTLQQAMRCHEASQMPEAEQLYQAVLRSQPEHAAANHNLGVLMLEGHKFDASLPHFEAAVAAQPESSRYWLSYIDALILAGQTELAQRTLVFGREHGLEGDEVDALAGLLAASPPAPSGAQAQPGVEAGR